MTSPHRRSSDATRRARLLAWWRTYWELVTGVWLILLTAGMFFFGFRAYETHRQFIQRERICSDTNQGDACRELYERIERSLTLDQRHRRVCLLIATLVEDPGVARVYKAQCTGG